MLGRHFDSPALFAWFTPSIVFAVIPFFDSVIGRDDTNIDALAERDFARNRFLRV